MPLPIFEPFHRAFGIPYTLRSPGAPDDPDPAWITPVNEDGVALADASAAAARTDLGADPRWTAYFPAAPYTQCGNCGDHFNVMAHRNTATIGAYRFAVSADGWTPPYSTEPWCTSCADEVSEDQLEDWYERDLIEHDGYGSWRRIPEPDYDDDPDYDEDYDEGDQSVPMPATSRTEQIDADGDPIPDHLTPEALTRLCDRLQLDDVDGRTPRTVSYEMEVGAGGEQIARQLYDIGLASGPDINGYHSSTTSGAFVHVEHDGSVNAEVIWRMMRLDQPSDVQRLAAGLYSVRRMQSRQAAALDTRCGGHLHVDASRTSMGAIVSLYHLFCGMEDTLYQISGSHWPQGHRSESGNSYADGPPKGVISHQEIYRTMRGGRYGINMSPYLRAMGSCSCDAYAVGMWERCTCQLPHPTIEFRLWNATTNLRKLRAHVALSIALIEHAVANPSISETFLPEFGFMRGRWLPTASRRPSATTIARTQRALALILGELPLGPNEREDVIYCLNHSLLGLPDNRALVAPDGFAAYLTNDQTVTV